MATSTPDVNLPGPTQASRVRGFATFFKSSQEWAIGRDRLATGNEGTALVQAIKFIGTGVKVPSQDEVLGTKMVPLSNYLMLSCLTIFVAAETAFILMALKEYLQDLAHISDLSLMGMEYKRSA